MCCNLFRSSRSRGKIAEIDDDDSDSEYLMENLVIHKVQKKCLKKEKKIVMNECEFVTKPATLRRHNSSPIVQDGIVKCCSSSIQPKLVKEVSVCCNMNPHELHEHHQQFEKQVKKKKDAGSNTDRPTSLIIQNKQSYEIVMPEDLEETINALRYSKPPRRLPGFPARNVRDVAIKKKKKSPKHETSSTKCNDVLDDFVKSLVDCGGDDGHDCIACRDHANTNDVMDGKRNLKWKLIIRHHPKN